MSHHRRHQHRHRSSGQQKQLRLVGGLCIVLVLVLFAVAFYWVNRWLNPVAI